MTNRRTFRRPSVVAIFCSSVLVFFPLLLEAQTNQFSCPAYGGGLLPVDWSPTYSAFIPADHISGPTTSSCINSTFGITPIIYKGDGQADIGDGWPFQSARTYSDYFFWGSFNNGAQNSPAYQSDFARYVGRTDNYGYGSPLNNSTLSALDQDNVRYDCLLWNDYGYADKSDMHGDLTVNGSTSQSGTAHFYGTASNPLENSFAKISWGMRIAMDGSNPGNARVTNVSYSHSCFPAHAVKVQRFTVYYWGPPRLDESYIAGCLVFQLGKIEGQTQPNKQVPCA